MANTLIEKVIQVSEENNIWTLYASIFPENEVSIYLHKKYGFRFIGKRERIAQQEGVSSNNLTLTYRYFLKRFSNKKEFGEILFYLKEEVKKWGCNLLENLFKK